MGLPLIQDRPEHGFGAQSEQFRPLLQSPPGLAQLGCLALPYGDHEGRRDEDADLTELDFFGLVVVTRGTQDDQAHVFVIALDLRPPVNDLRVLDRQAP